MKKRSYSFIGIFLTSAIFVVSMFMIHTMHTSPLFHTDGVATSALKKIFDHLGVSISTLEQANAFAQKNLLRTGERWDTQSLTDVQKKMHANAQVLMEDLRALGMIDAVAPTKTEYEYALLMGSLKDTVSKRLAYLTHLCQQGYAFKTIVLLGGERTLRDIEKNELPSEVLTETDMMKYLCQECTALKNHEILVVNAPMIKKDDGTFTRPTTDSTLQYFANIAPRNGTCLVISNNPYVIRQTGVATRILDQSRFACEGAGVALDNEDDADIVMLMDEFARTLYEQYKQLKVK